MQQITRKCVDKLKEETKFKIIYILFFVNLTTIYLLLNYNSPKKKYKIRIALHTCI